VSYFATPGARCETFLPADLRHIFERGSNLFFGMWIIFFSKFEYLKLVAPIPGTPDGEILRHTKMCKLSKLPFNCLGYTWVSAPQRTKQAVRPACLPAWHRYRPWFSDLACHIFCNFQKILIFYFSISPRWFTVHFFLISFVFRYTFSLCLFVLDSYVSCCTMSVIETDR
jgi:hypothetical protein